MIKRTTGRVLLTLLVITGLAGTISDNTPTKAERKSAINLMKNTRSDLLKTVGGLSEAQLNYKPSPESWSVKECMYHIAVSEQNLWGMIEQNLKAAANPEKRAEVKMTDEQVITMIENRERKVKTFETFEPKNTPYKTMEEAIAAFKMLRADHIKYMKTTTEDLRNHVAQLPVGYLDSYQCILFMAAHTERHRLQMEEVKASPGFPSK